MHSAMNWKYKWSQKHSEIYINMSTASSPTRTYSQRSFICRCVAEVLGSGDFYSGRKPWHCHLKRPRFLALCIFSNVSAQKINSMNTHSLHDKCFQWFITKKKSVLWHTNETPRLALIDFSMHSILDAWQLALDDTSHPGGKQTEYSKFCIGCWEQSVVWSLRKNSLTLRLSGRQSCPLWPLQRLAPLIDRGWSWL